MRALLAVSALVALLMLGNPTAASASCAEEPTDSPYAFTGTVISVEGEGRLARVVLDNGNRVEVHGSSDPRSGTPSPRSTGGSPRAAGTSSTR